MSDEEVFLRRFLQFHVDHEQRNGGLSVHKYLLEHGRMMTPADLRKDVCRGQLKECFANAGRLACKRDEFTYVEGYAVAAIPCLHAWCLDENGVVVDLTWKKGWGLAYFGITINTHTHSGSTHCNTATGAPTLPNKQPNTMSDYIPIPVVAAQRVATAYQKHAVVILAWDEVHQLNHTTTYGTTPFHKENAAAVGRIATAAIGMDMGKIHEYEDFHKDYNPANYKAAVELLKDLLNNSPMQWADNQRVSKFLDQIKQ